MKELSLTISAAVLMITTTIAGDILTLTNNMVFEGKVKKIKQCEVVFSMDGDRFVIPAEEIYSIQFHDVNDDLYIEYVNGPDDVSNCFKGRTDAQSLHGKKGGHFILGVLFGPFAMIGTALSDPTPFRSTTTLALSQNKELFTDPEYLICYRKRAKGQLILMEAAGWGAFLLFYTVLNSGS